MSRVIIVGAGIFGITAALELRKRGYEVEVLDPGPVPHPDASSTDISKVLRMDYGSDRFYLNLMRKAFAGWAAWNERWPEPLYHQTGVLMLSRSEMQPGGYEFESYQLLQEEGIFVERMSPDLLKDRFPAWKSDHYPDGYFNPQGGWAESGRVVEKITQEFVSKGGLIRTGMKFTSWIASGSRVNGLKTTSGENVYADHFVLAAGAWTPSLHPDLNNMMWPVAQDVLHFQVNSKSYFQPPYFPVYTADVARSGWYGFPAKDNGVIKVANHGRGRRIDPSGPRRVEETSEARFRKFFKDTFPALVDAPIVHKRVCFYADTFDGDFLIAEDPAREGLVVASGGSGHAFKFAPLLGSLIADVMEKKPNPDAARFAWRNVGIRRKEDARFEGD